MANVAKKWKETNGVRKNKFHCNRGATTSKAHTAVKIAPNYSGQLLFPDASRSVPVAQSLTKNDAKRKAYIDEIKSDYSALKGKYSNRQNTKLIPIEDARKNAPKTNFEIETPVPKIMGRRLLKDFPLEKLVKTIDWSPFFRSWDLAGKYPEILKDNIVGSQASDLFNDGNKLLDKIVKRKLLVADGLFGIFPARRTDHEDITIYSDESLTRKILTWYGVRQQSKKPRDEKNKCLADYVSPLNQDRKDYLGVFFVTINGSHKLAEEFEKQDDDYNSIMVKALADNLLSPLLNIYIS